MAPRCDFSKQVRSRYPFDFLQRIQMENSKPKLQNALVLISAKDDFDVFSNFATQFSILNIAQTYNVSLQIISKISQIHEYLASDPKPIDLLVFEAHGSKEGMELGDELYTCKDMKASDFEGMKGDGVIFLHSCSTATIAPDLTRISKKIVYAPLNDLSSMNTMYSYCSEHKCYEMLNYEDGVQYVQRFEDNKVAVKCSRSKEEIEKFRDSLKTYLLNSDKEVCFNEFSRSLNIKSISSPQLMLGTIYLQENSLIKAEECFLEAIKNYDIRGLVGLADLGEKYLNQSKLQMAEKYFLRVVENCRIGTDDRYIPVAYIEATAGLGKLNFQLGNLEGAKKWYLEVIKTRSSDLLRSSHYTFAFLSLCLICDINKQFDKFNDFKTESSLFNYNNRHDPLELGKVLIKAIEKNAIHTIKHLLDFEQLPKVGENSLSHALNIAVANDNVEAVELIISDKGFIEISENGQYSIEEAYKTALKNGNDKIAKMLKETGRVFEECE